MRTGTLQGELSERFSLGTLDSRVKVTQVTVPGTTLAAQ